MCFYKTFTPIPNMERKVQDLRKLMESSANTYVLDRQMAHIQWQQQQQYEANYNVNNDGFLSLHNNTISAEEEEVEESGEKKANAAAAKKRKTYPTEEGDGGSDQSPKEKENKKTDYIHVRARRGQATDSHSLAERVRRERISERMKYLQGLVPGCNKITGKAGMLDEIINYVQSLQKQVEFLSMKLATVNPRPDFNAESLFNKEMINLIGDSTMTDASYIHSSLVQQMTNCCGYDMTMTGTSVSSPEAFLDPCFNVNSLYGVEFHQGRAPAYPFPSMQGNLSPSNLKMEM